MLQEISVVRYDEARSIEVLQHVFDDVFGVEIQMVRRFIHDDDVWFGQEHLGECDLGSFSS